MLKLYSGYLYPNQLPRFSPERFFSFEFPKNSSVFAGNLDMKNWLKLMNGRFERGVGKEQRIQINNL